MFVLFSNISLSYYVLECPLGYYNKNCSTKCHAPYYGKKCQSICECPDANCHFATGCLQRVDTYTGYQPRGILF